MTRTSIKPLLGSASGLGRAIKCPASKALPQEERPPGEAALRGTRIHKFLELAFVDQEEALKAAGKNSRTCKKIDLLNVAGRYTASGEREVAFVYDVNKQTCRFYQGIDREYIIESEDEVPGTMDVIIPGFLHAEVWDYKTGRTDYGPPDESAQLLFGALGVHKTYAQKAVSFTIGYQYLRAGGEFENEYATVDLLDVHTFAHRLSEALDQAKKLRTDGVATKDVNVGEHCSYCPAMAACPNRQEVIQFLKGENR